MRKKKGGHGGGGGGHDAAGGLRWLLTYADVITLLLALFIYLYSISEINEEKMNNFAESMRDLFGISVGSGILAGNKQFIPVLSSVDEAFIDLTKKGFGKFAGNDKGFTLTLPDEVLFEEQSSVLSERGKLSLLKAAKFFGGFTKPIQIVGHTDDLPVSARAHASNLSLSVDHALAVAEFFITTGTVDPARISVAGYGEYVPLQPNVTGKGNLVNRRVEITIMDKTSHHLSEIEQLTEGAAQEGAGGEDLAEQPEGDFSSKPEWVRQFQNGFNHDDPKQAESAGSGSPH